MANGYPCPACGDEEAELFLIADRPDNFDSGHPASGCGYACDPCISAARMIAGEPVVMHANDITATTHQ